MPNHLSICSVTQGPCWFSQEGWLPSNPSHRGFQSPLSLTLSQCAQVTFPIHWPILLILRNLPCCNEERFQAVGTSFRPHCREITLEWFDVEPRGFSMRCKVSGLLAAAAASELGQGDFAKGSDFQRGWKCIFSISRLAFVFPTLSRLNGLKEIPLSCLMMGDSNSAVNSLPMTSGYQ